MKAQWNQFKAGLTVVIQRGGSRDQNKEEERSKAEAQTEEL